MKLSNRFTLGISVLVLAGTIALPSTASASGKRTTYKPCSVLAKELATKINRLNKLAGERRAQGDSYGERRLRSMANVVGAHRGNLPCVGRRTCAL